MKILLSIKPKFVKKILSWEKLYEFRKKIPEDIKNVAIYSSSPEQRVIWEFEVIEVIKLNPSKLWELTKSWAGIEQEYFDEYFEWKDFWYAIKIGKINKYNISKKLSEYNIKTPPQNFMYLKRDN